MIDMRDYIQEQLDLWNLGSLVTVQGPEVARGDDYYELVVKYRLDENKNRHDVQFYDGRIQINIGYTRKGGYWNRRCIRLAIAQEGKEKREEQRSKIVWASAQKELTAGPSGRDSGGAFAL